MDYYTSLVGVFVVPFLIMGVYLFPCILAVWRGHRNAMPIVLVCVLFGWTVIGWIASLVWACSDNAD